LDVKRYEDFADRKIYDLLSRGEDNARAVGAKSIQLWKFPITAGLRDSVLAGKLTKSLNCSRL
jgi:hypothetical protein